MGLKFTCPHCGCERLECCLDGPHTAPITDIDEEGDFDYGNYESSADVEKFQCIECGCVLEQRGGPGFKSYILTQHDEVVEWIKKNCEQG